MVDNFVKRRGSVPSVPSSAGARGTVTSMNSQGLLQRRINRNSILDSGVRVEYEDDDMNLENEGNAQQSLLDHWRIVSHECSLRTLMASSLGSSFQSEKFTK